MPVPVCPQGVVESLPADAVPQTAPPPGVSPLDEGLRHLAEAHVIDAQNEEGSDGDDHGAGPVEFDGRTE